MIVAPVINIINNIMIVIIIALIVVLMIKEEKTWIFAICYTEYNG